VFERERRHTRLEIEEDDGVEGVVEVEEKEKREERGKLTIVWVCLRGGNRELRA
jgi:hypothetical protein